VRAWSGAPFAAIHRGRIAVLTIAATYVLSVAAGIAMVGTGNEFALARRDAIVEGARSSATLVADRSGDHLRAALLDFASNLGAGIGSAVTGITVVGAYPIVAYRGWIGGIVSVDARHRSRLGDPGSATYYLMTLVLQLIPYSIAGGMGVRLGVGAWRAVRVPRADTWLGLPTDLLRDAVLAFVVIVPLFLVASLWEFLAR
jgi:uncharacterized membrane protein SpoIIM required for sporulation